MRAAEPRFVIVFFIVFPRRFEVTAFAKWKQRHTGAAQRTRIAAPGLIRFSAPALLKKITHHFERRLRADRRLRKTSSEAASYFFVSRHFINWSCHERAVDQSQFQFISDFDAHLRQELARQHQRRGVSAGGNLLAHCINLRPDATHIFRKARWRVKAVVLDYLTPHSQIPNDTFLSSGCFDCFRASAI